MALTKRTDQIIPELLTEAIQGAFPKMRVLMGSKAVVIKNTMPDSANGAPIKGGDTVSIPYFNILGDELEEIANEGDALTPATLSMTKEQATVRHYGKAIELTSWAQLAANYADPYGEAARQFIEMTQNKIENVLIATASNGLDPAFVNDVFNAGVPKTLDYDTAIDSKLKWGDEQGNIELMSVHSKVFGDLLKLKDSTGRPLITDPNNAELMKFVGIPLKVSDRNTVTLSGGVRKYSTKIFKAGSMAFWYQQAPRVRTEPDALADSDITAIHVYGAPYRYKRAPGGSKPGVVEIFTN